jgi:phage shock protein A
MSILRDMFTALKGAGSEAGEAIVDANAIRILEQEIREAEEAIHKARQSLTRLKSTEIRLKRDVNSLNADIADYEVKAVEALDAGKEDIAIKVADRIAEIETDRDEKSEEHSKLAAEVETINKMIKNRNKIIQKLTIKSEAAQRLVVIVVQFAGCRIDCRIR